EPRRSHDHRLAALPIDFAFLDVFVFEVVEQATGEQRDEDEREAVRLLVLKAIIAGDVAFRGRKEDHAKDSATHGLSLPVERSCSSLLTRSRSISSAAASIIENSCFTPPQEYAGSGHLKYPCRPAARGGSRIRHPVRQGS